MALMNVLAVPHPDLYKRCEEVPAVTNEIRTLMEDMVETMLAHEGGGLAANQVGVLKRIVVMQVGESNTIDDDYPSELKNLTLKMANPKIISYSNETNIFEEGCLSVPGQRVPVERPVSVTVDFINESNKQQTMVLNGYLGRCIQHEIDHLDGKTTLEHISKLKKQMALRRIQKEQNQK